MAHNIINLGLASEATKGSIGTFVEISVLSGTVCHPSFSVDGNGTCGCLG